MNRSITLDRKILELQKAVQSLKNNRDNLVKELEIIKTRTAQKSAV